jgi:L-rhamnose mutarotase
MPYLLIRHKVEDYDRWKPVFDEDAKNRARHGSKNGALFRNRNNANEIVAMWEFDDAEQMEAFTQSPELRERMGRAGVADHPDIYFLDLVERPER